jgi:hypothetical protein
MRDAVDRSGPSLITFAFGVREKYQPEHQQDDHEHGERLVDHPVDRDLYCPKPEVIPGVPFRLTVNQESEHKIDRGRQDPERPVVK